MNEVLTVIDSHYCFSGKPESSEKMKAKVEPGLQKRLALPNGIREALSLNGVGGSILIQEQNDLGLSERLLYGVSADPFVEGIVVRLDLKSPRVSDVLDKLIKSPKFRGVYYPLHEETDNRWFLSPPVMRGLKEVAARGLSFDAPVQPRHLRWVPELARELPTLKIAIDHIGSPAIAAGQREPWGVFMAAASESPNIWCKVSGLVALDAESKGQQARINPFVETVVRLFGYDRVMFGSNWAVSRDHSEYGRTIEIAVNAVGNMTAAQRKLFLGDVARTFYGTD